MKVHNTQNYKEPQCAAVCLVMNRRCLKEMLELNASGLTLLTAQQPLNAFHEFVPVAVRVNPDLLELLMAHVSQNIQRNLTQQMNINQN